MGVVAVYLRLSLEDRDRPDGGDDVPESNSITSQRALIHSYIEQDAELKGLDVKEFCDDGWSGSGMDRPGMNSLLAEVKKNLVQCIIVKDLSRFSRDYIELGTYMNQILPFMGVRLIAIGDRYDSREHCGSTIGLDTAFKTLLYDLYSKDISVKVKASFENKCAGGEYVFGQVPFGYEKDRERKNEVIVNEKEAAVVRKIFSMACEGKSSTEIARALHEGGVPTVRQMRGQKPLGNKGYGTWGNSSVRKILKNRFYLGEMSYGKTAREHVGSSRARHIREDEWKVIPGHHEPLVTLEQFEKAACAGLPHSTERKREKHPLVGKLSCGGCGYAMVYKPLRPGNKYRRFECHRHAILKIPECCTYFNADVLEELVLSMINKELVLCGEAARQAAGLGQLQKSRITELEKKLKSLNLEKKQAEAARDVLYEKYALREMDQKEYRKAADTKDREIASISEQIRACREDISLLKGEQEKLQADMKQVIRYSHMEELTQTLVGTFIKKIYVYKDKRVEIEWNFQNECL